MHKCRVVPVTDRAGRTYTWEWRMIGGERKSERRFPSFYECMDDARRRGLEVVMDRPIGDMAPDRYAVAPE